MINDRQKMKTQIYITSTTHPNASVRRFRTACASIALLLPLASPFAVQAQYNYHDNGDGTCIIVSYTGSGNVAVIPDKINGLLVTGIGEYAFAGCSSLKSVTMGSGVTNIDFGAFEGCTNLTDLTIGSGVTSIGNYAFDSCSSLISVTIPGKVADIGQNAFCFCTSLTRATINNGVPYIGDAMFASCVSLANVAIPDSVTNIGSQAFDDCWSLINIIIPSKVISIGDGAFGSCYDNLAGVYFQGNAPSVGSSVFYCDNNVTVYYLPGTTGWASTFGGRPTALWYLPNPLILDNNGSFGVQANQFGFTISWATNISVVVEARTNLAIGTWVPLQTNALTSGTNYFSDSKWTNYPGRFYRLRSP